MDDPVAAARQLQHREIIRGELCHGLYLPAVEGDQQQLPCFFQLFGTVLQCRDQGCHGVLSHADRAVYQLQPRIQYGRCFAV